MHPTVNIAVRAARAAGDIIVRSMDKIDHLKIATKRNNDFVTEVDRKAEEAIIDILRQSYPEYGILAEESGLQGEGAEFQWIIDPLDGTTNYLHGFPQFSVSIALTQKDRIIAGVIYDPMSQELFTASKGDGAQLNGKKLRVSGQVGLKGALLSTGFPYHDQSYLDTYLKTMKQMMAPAAGIRRPGSAALDLAWLAAGRTDGFWEFNLNAWDIAAGILLVREAGGIITDFAGGDRYLETGDIIAASPKVFPEMMKIISSSVKGSAYAERKGI
ncbi:MAG: inositol monophosphatase [Gammaproteobacteria bacterium]|nr:inositol monophosphatase [Gammaproteobacteria bacterium]MCW8923818.1 inositol monophosphatase [Gammaproteobacteria bacterium]